MISQNRHFNKSKKIKFKREQIEKDSVNNEAIYDRSTSICSTYARTSVSLGDQIDPEK